MSVLDDMERVHCGLSSASALEHVSAWLLYTDIDKQEHICNFLYDDMIYDICTVSAITTNKKNIAIFVVLFTVGDDDVHIDKNYNLLVFNGNGVREKGTYKIG